MAGQWHRSMQPETLPLILSLCCEHRSLNDELGDRGGFQNLSVSLWSEELKDQKAREHGCGTV